MIGLTRRLQRTPQLRRPPIPGLRGAGSLRRVVGQGRTADMDSLTQPLVAFLLTGSYLLFWPAYRLVHRRKTFRRQALFRLFVIELAIYVPITILVLVGIYTIRDFHHAFLVVEAVYVLMAVFLWAVTFGVWADNSPEVCE